MRLRRRAPAPPPSRKFIFNGSDVESFSVVVEPWGTEFVVKTGDHISVQIVGSNEDVVVTYAPGYIEIWLTGGSDARVWDSEGNELPV